MEKRGNSRAFFVAQAGIIAALYVVATVFVSAFGLASGAIQVRLSEALTILPVFTPAAVPGLFIGCLIANTVTGAVIWDIIFGSIATLLGAVFTYLLRKTKFLFTLPPVVFNALILPPVLKMAYHVPDAYLFLVLSVGAGELLSVCIFGYALKRILDRYQNVMELS